MTYPSGRVADYVHDAAGRTKEVLGYVSSVACAPHGESVNAAAISSVASHVWPRIGTTSAVRRDGNLASEAWALLRQPWIQSSVLAQLLREEIRRRGLSSEAVFLLLDRPLPEVRADIRRYADKPAHGESVFVAVAALIVLDILGDDSARAEAEKLEKTARPLDSPVFQTIVNKMSGGRPVLWSDLEPLLEDR